MRLAVILTLFSLFLMGCSPDVIQNNSEALNSDSKVTKNSVTINNYTSSGKKMKIVLEKVPSRVVVHHQNIMEALMAIDCEEKIVAAAFAGTDTKKFSKEYVEKAKKIPVINDYNFDLETVLMCRPEMIIGWQSTFSNKVMRTTEFWNKRGVKTYIAANSNNILPVGKIEDEYVFLNDIGRIFDKERQMNDSINAIKTEIDNVKQQTKNLPKQKVLIIEFFGTKITTYDKTRLGGDMVTKLGGELIDCSRNIDAETLIGLDPDVIFIVSTRGTSDKQMYLNKILGNPVFRSMKAVKNNRIYVMPLIYMYVSGTRTLDGVKAFRDGLYPWMKDGMKYEFE